MLHRQSLSLRQILLHSKTPGTVLYIPVLLVPLSNKIEKAKVGFSPLLTACPCMFVDEVYTTDAVCWNGEHIALK